MNHQLSHSANGVPKQMRTLGPRKRKCLPQITQPTGRRVFAGGAGPRLSLQTSTTSSLSFGHHQRPPKQHEGSTSPEQLPLPAADTLHCGPAAQGVILESASSPLTAGSPEFMPRPPPWPLPPCKPLSLLLPRPPLGLPI